jgi:hypothetical protein
MILDTLPADPGALISAAQIGAYWTAIVSRRCGLASTPHRGHCEGQGDFDAAPADEVVGRPAQEIARWALEAGTRAGEGDPAANIRAAVGMAALNSLIEPDLSRCVDVNARDVLLERGRGRSVAMIGHFPFTDELRAAAGQLWVLELFPHPGDLPADQASVVLPQADVVGITGVTLINGTFDGLAALCRPDAYVVLLGGTAPLTPALFDFGVDAVAGSIVEDAAAVMEGIAAGATFRQMRGKRPVLMLK